MLNFDEERFVRIQSGVVSLGEHIHEVIGARLSGGAQNLFFLGSGGAGILMLPAADLLQTRSLFPVFSKSPAEIVAIGSVHLGPQSIVVIPSLSGTTKESVEALEYCRTKGATVIALVGLSGTPLSDNANHALVNFAEDDTSSESFYLQALLVALSLMHHRGEFEPYTAVLEQLTQLPPLLLDVKRSFEPHAEALAEQIKDERFHIITGAGSTWPEALYYGMCILEEMQWIRTRPVHAADFFHGTLELVEEGVSVIVLKGEDANRALCQRVESFAASYTDKLRVLDTAQFKLPGISADVRALISPVLLATVLERVSAHLEVKRNHPLTTRRYYKRVAY
jgi:fructoselysine-6-phosphate deglycase